MFRFNLFGINEVEIVSSALYAYGQFMLESGNQSRATKVLEILDRLHSNK